MESKSIEQLENDYWNNSTYSELEIRLFSRPDLEFKLTRLDFFKKMYARVCYRVKASLIGNFLLKSSDLNKAKRIIDTLPINKLFVESIELRNGDKASNLLLITREDFIRQENAALYVKFLFRIATQINNT